jgi:tetratricopeptide repeat protein 21B
MLLADVHSGAENMERVPETLMKARSLQAQLLESVRGDSAEAMRVQHSVMADVCVKLAQHYEKCRNDEKAMQYYNEALRADDAHENSMLLLAKMHLRRGELEACQHQCVTLMRISRDGVDEEPSMMLADLMFRRNEYDTATFQFQQLLEKKPNNFQALSRLIMLLRRAGKLDEAVDFIKNASAHSSRAVHLPGLNFCKGLHARYTNHVHEAIKHFNLARRDTEFGEQAITHMVEIYLNPDNEVCTVYHAHPNTLQLPYGCLVCSFWRLLLLLYPLFLTLLLYPLLLLRMSGKTQKTRRTARMLTANRRRKHSQRPTPRILCGWRRS